MKNRFHVLLISALILGSTSVFAAREPQVNVVSQGDNKLMMELFMYEASAVVRIVDEKGYLLFSEKTGQNPQYAKVFDMEPLPEGSYRFEVEGENTIQIIDFKVNKSKLKLIGEMVTYYKPVIRQKGEVADLQLFNASEQPVSVTFRNADGQLLLRHAPKTALRIEERFDLAELTPGSYSMTVQVGKKIYQKQLMIN